MKKMTRHYKRLRFLRIKVAALVILINIIFVPTFCKYEKDAENLFHIFVNGTDVGYLGSIDNLQDMIADARRQIGKDKDMVVYAEADVTYESSSVMFAEVESEHTVRERIAGVIAGDAADVLQHAYTMRIGDYTVNLASSDDVREVLQSALNLFEERQQFVATLASDTSRELNVLTVSVITNEEAKEAEESADVVKTAGFDAFLDSAEEVELDSDILSFENYDYGIMDMNFGDNIEIVDSYLTADQIMSVQEAIDMVVSVQEKNTIYEVQSGDTLSEIAIKTEIPMDKIIELNANLDNENSTIRVGDELIVTTVEPPISVERTEQEYIEEFYDEDIQYVDNDDWYTTEQVTLQQPSAGRRNIVAKISYKNDKEVAREVIKEEVLMEAVPKIVERGTKIPPSYIKPLSGGRMSSGYGGRKAPTKGASTNHKGIDWATPVGTAIYASSGGVVTKAGWGSGYGNVVYIKHPDGKETRYGHLSKVLVSPGQTVKQGQKIALSGNTGRSTGPHLHFEIRINGAAVNPLKYLN
ncbi:MAG: M23 family metallopeptidase [Lachnospiraceae bacterium]|nr:M23 family metallopeptidase [Candidatus Colinaster scatohippi]